MHACCLGFTEVSSLQADGSSTSLFTSLPSFFFLSLLSPTLITQSRQQCPTPNAAVAEVAFAVEADAAEVRPWSSPTARAARLVVEEAILEVEEAVEETLASEEVEVVSEEVEIWAPEFTSMYQPSQIMETHMALTRPPLLQPRWPNPILGFSCHEHGE